MHTHHNHEHRGALPAAIALNALIVAAELTGGIWANSLSLLSDALHNAGDLLALTLSYAAARYAAKKATPEMSFGYIRAEFTAAFVNSSLLLATGGYILYEGVVRLFHPPAVNGAWVTVTAAAALAANAASSYLLHRGAKQNINIRSAYLHLVYDALHSFGVVLAGILIWLTGWYIADPLFSVIIGVLIIRSSWKIIAESSSILHEATPKSIDAGAVEAFIKKQPEVQGVHHLHIWQLSSNIIALSAHIVVNDRLISEGYLIIDRMERKLKEQFGINHPTLQLEADMHSEQQNGIPINGVRQQG